MSASKRSRGTVVLQTIIQSGDGWTGTHVDLAEGIQRQVNLDQLPPEVWGFGAEGEQLQDVEGQLLDDLQVGCNEHEEWRGEGLPHIRLRMAVVGAAMTRQRRLCYRIAVTHIIDCTAC
jgi:hypothetical protein